MKLKSLLAFGLIIMTLNASAETTEATPKLPPCPNTPNCVSSQAADTEHLIAPFRIKGNPEAAFAALKTALLQQIRTVITGMTAESLHAEATSLIFRFVDDIDALLDANAGVIHIRSASRVGYSDLGVNRRRVEALRTALQQAGVIA